MSWEQLVAISKNRRADYEADRRNPPTACPYDGEPLQRVHGKLHCPFDGWTWPDDPNPLLDQGA